MLYQGVQKVKPAGWLLSGRVTYGPVWLFIGVFAM